MELELCETIYSVNLGINGHIVTFFKTLKDAELFLSRNNSATQRCSIDKIPIFRIIEKGEIENE